MARKVKIAIFDNDLQVTVKKCPISNDGTQIRVKSGGEGHFMPRFSPNNALEFKRPWYFGGGTQKLYFAKKLAEGCVDFTTDPPTIPLPNREQLKYANANLLATKVGQDSSKGTPWYIWVILALNTLAFILLLQMAGVMR